LSIAEQLKAGVESIGSAVLDAIENFGQVVILLVQTLVWMVRPPYRLRILLQALESIGVGSLFIVVFTGLFTGLVMAYQSIYAFSLFGAETLVGGTVAAAVVRELGPVLTGLMVAGRTGSAMTTELGTMRVTEQIDAMAVMAVNPVQYLVMPRVVATTLMMPLLVMIFDLVAIGAAYALSVELMNIDPGIFTQKIKDFVDVRDVFNSAFKAGTFGLAIGLVGCYKGFYASGGAKGVGEATTSSVVTSSISVLVLDYILTVFMYSNA
jgi:phospholipid/cholesterol/gamma-HCH transport system permease protein